MYGLICNEATIQELMICEFNDISPNQRSHQLTYQAMASTSLFFDLSNSHQEHGLEILLRNQTNVHQHLYTNLIIQNTSKRHEFCRKWFEIPTKRLLSFRLFCDLQKSLLQPKKSFEYPLQLNGSITERFEFMKIMLIESDKEMFHELILVWLLNRSDYFVKANQERKRLLLFQ